ncbi:MAG TPA: GH25 family lysozyme [Gaiellaceae bacterium]|nr:GH25 family lysozyme [Gaiellaceae bacterium]
MHRRFLLLVAVFGMASPAVAAPFVRGVDVSHWRGSIAWPRVAHGGYRFAFAEATNGFAVDPTFVRNRSGAKAARIAFAGFHFARPAGSTRSGVLANAVAQADFFVSVAQPQTGELAPVLDLERTGGLSASSLRAWTSAWLDEVQQKVGIRPTIYASPTFWRRAVGDASVFAAAGSSLWVAHWHVRSPRVPAADWGATGWTFWQWTDCSHVLGIRGCVDGDVYRDTRVASAVMAPQPVTIDAPTVAGVPETGQLLSATTGTWQADPAPTLSYRWQHCTDTSAATCVWIPNAVTSTYSVTSADAGSTLRVVVTATSRGRSANSASTAVPVNA